MSGAQHTVPAETLLAAAREVVSREARALAGLVDQLDTSFLTVVETVAATTGKVVTTGSGTSGIMAERLAHLLSVCGTPAVYLPSMDALHGGMGAITPTDLVIAISKTGQSAELTDLVERLDRRGIHVVAVTESPDSPFARAASSVAHVRTDPADADPGDMIAMASTLAVGAWGDAVAVVTMSMRGHSWSERHRQSPRRRRRSSDRPARPRRPTRDRPPEAAETPETTVGAGPESHDDDTLVAGRRLVDAVVQGRDAATRRPAGCSARARHRTRRPFRRAASSIRSDWVSAFVAAAEPR